MCENTMFFYSVSNRTPAMMMFWLVLEGDRVENALPIATVRGYTVYPRIFSRSLAKPIGSFFKILGVLSSPRKENPQNMRWLGRSTASMLRLLGKG